MRNVKIAIIDNGIDESFLKKPLEYKILVTNDGNCIPDDSNMEQVSFMHGTICAIIIETHFPNCALSSVKVLNEDGTGILTKLQPAMEWCLQHQIKIINLSLGSVHFKDKDLIRTLINQYAVQGLLVIAATSNIGYVSYPASLSNVIGVAMDSGKHDKFSGNGHLGIDVLVPLEHELMIKGKKIAAPKSNSYATPYITALAGRLYCKKASLDICEINICEIKQTLRSVSKYHGIHLLPEYNEPDWIHTALIRTSGDKSNAAYYFNTTDETVPEEMYRIDTVIIDDLSDMKKWACQDKHIVYLGKEKIKQPPVNRFFWSSQNRLRQILNSMNDEKGSELNIPIILCQWEGDLDEMFLLSELKKSFYRDGYHIYAVSFHIESVLYDLEYIPEEALEKKYETLFNRFIYCQTYYKQNDALLFGLHPNLMQKSAQLQDRADLRITLVQKKRNLEVSFWYEGIVAGKLLFQKINSRSIQMIFQKTKEILAGNDDE